MKRQRSRSALFALLPWVVPVACLALPEGTLPPSKKDTDAGPPPILELDGSAPRLDPDARLPEAPAHSVISVDPAHGPFDGGNRAVVRGTGFSSAVRIWFGPNEVPPGDIVPIDPTRVQVSVPSGTAGTTSVTAQNGDDASTRATLAEGYVYDAFYADPASGPLSGGTIVTLHGNGTAWDDSTSVYVDGVACDVLDVRSPKGEPQELDCRTPPGTPGAKAIRVVSGETTEDVLDAFVYGDSENGFRGGLSGAPLDGTLRVVALNSYTGRGLGKAKVILGADVSNDSLLTADENGVVVVNRKGLGPKQTVTIAARCFNPVTFVDVPVGVVTAYLDPILTPACIDNGQLTAIGSGGGSTRVGATIEGELVWPRRLEFQRGTWDVPNVAEISAADPKVRRAAYLFQLSSDPNQTFFLPDANVGVTPDDAGRIGYQFSMNTGVGNLTLYALAGIEDRNPKPPRFTAYTMGLIGGVSARPGEKTTDVYVQMDIPLDHTITLDVSGPKPTAVGPDHVEGRVAVRVGTLGYLTLPVGTASALLPATSPLSFVGLPPLVRALSGAEYIMTASASTGPDDAPPRSVLGLFSSTTPSAALPLDEFVEVPVIESPAAHGAWDGQHLAASAAKGGPVPDLALFEIESGGGLIDWQIVAPRGVLSVDVPDLSTLGPLVGPSGPLTVTVSLAKISGFDYGSLRYSNLTPRGWNAYATNVVDAHH